jgi:O-antigen/teichoic acid export membrane protein
MFVRMGGGPGYLRRVTLLGLLLIGPSILYVILCWAFGPLLFKLLYDGGYSSVANVLWLIILPMVPASVVAVLSAAMRALEAPRQVFVAYIGSTAVCVCIGMPLAYHYSVVGVSIGITLSSAVCGVILAVQLWRLMRHRETEQLSPGVCETI